MAEAGIDLKNRPQAITRGEWRRRQLTKTAKKALLPLTTIAVVGAAAVMATQRGEPVTAEQVTVPPGISEPATPPSTQDVVQVQKLNYLSLVTKSPQEQEVAEKEIEKQHFENIPPIVKKRQALVTRIANEVGVDPSLALSILAAEIGWQEGVTSSAGAKGDFQIKDGAARDMGLEISDDPNLDERNSPEKSARTALKYLKQQISRFGDIQWGIFAYHAGATNTADIIYECPKVDKTDNILTKPDLEEGLSENQFLPYAYRIKKDNLSVHTVVSDPTAKSYIETSSHLDNASLIYNYRVAAAMKAISHG